MDSHIRKSSCRVQVDGRTRTDTYLQLFEPAPSLGTRSPEPFDALPRSVEIKREAVPSASQACSPAKSLGRVTAKNNLGVGF